MFYYKRRAHKNFKDIYEYVEENIFNNNEDFKSHITQVSNVLDVDRELIERTVKAFIISSLRLIRGFKSLTRRQFHFKYFILWVRRRERPKLKKINILRQEAINKQLNLNNDE